MLNLLQNIINGKTERISYLKFRLAQPSVLSPRFELVFEWIAFKKDSITCQTVDRQKLTVRSTGKCAIHAIYLLWLRMVKVILITFCLYTLMTNSNYILCHIMPSYLIKLIHCWWIPWKLAGWEFELARYFIWWNSREFFENLFIFFLNFRNKILNFFFWKWVPSCQFDFVCSGHLSALFCTQLTLVLSLKLNAKTNSKWIKGNI